MTCPSADGSSVCSQGAAVSSPTIPAHPRDDTGPPSLVVTCLSLYIFVFAMHRLNDLFIPFSICSYDSSMAFFFWGGWSYFNDLLHQQTTAGIYHSQPETFVIIPGHLIKQKEMCSEALGILLRLGKRWLDSGNEHVLT